MKAFRVYGGENKNCNNTESATATTSEDEDDSDTQGEEKCKEIEYVEVADILAKDDLESHLPKNQRWMKHTKRYQDHPSPNVEPCGTSVAGPPKCRDGGRVMW